MKPKFESYAANWSDGSMRIFNTPSDLAKSTYFYLQESGHFVTFSGYYTERFHLTSYLILYTTSGQGLLEYDGETYSLPADSVFFIDCQNYHKYRIDADRWEFYWVHFDGATTDGYYQHFFEKSGPVVDVGTSPEILDIIRKIIFTNKTKQQQSELITSGLLVELMTELILSSNSITKESQMPETIREIILYIEQNYHKPITLDEISRNFALSKYHLSRQIHKYTGFSPVEYLIRQRITSAKELLKNTDLSLAEIAETVGISTENHFCTLFKARTDITPRAFRKMWKSR